MNAKRLPLPCHWDAIEAHKQNCAARHVLGIAAEFVSLKLTPSLPRCVKAGVNFRDENRNEELRTGGEGELELKGREV